MRNVIIKKASENNIINALALEIGELDLSKVGTGVALNFIIGSDHDDWTLTGLMFGPIVEGEEFILLEDKEWTWPKLLAYLGCFPSAVEAAAHWKKNAMKLDFVQGYTEIFTGKEEKTRICLWKPFRIGL